jgi:outer membrane protein TolC
MGSKTVHNPRIGFAALSLLLATPLAAWCQQSTPSAAELLSLDQAINIALQNNRSLKNARLNVEKGEDEILSIRTSRLRSGTLRSCGGTYGALDHGHAVWVYGFPGNH